MCRLLSLAVLFFSILEIVHAAAPIPVAPNDPTKDREGNPLPKGTTARLGTLCFRGITTTGLKFSQDGKFFYVPHHDRSYPNPDDKNSAPKKGTLLVWESDTGKQIASRPFEPAVPVGSVVSSCVVGDRIVTLHYEPRMGNKKMSEECPVRVTLSAVSDGKETTHFDIFLTQPQRWSEFRFVESDYGPTFTFTAVSPDGRYLVAASVSEEAVLVYDLKLEKQIRSHPLTASSTRGILISPDSKTLFINEGNKSLSRYDLASGKELPAYAESGFNFPSLAISPDAKRAISIGYTGEIDVQNPRTRLMKTGDLFVRDADSGKVTAKIPVEGTIYSFQFVTNDAVLVTHSAPGHFGEKTCVSRWNTATLQRAWQTVMPRGAVSLRVSLDGKQFALLGNEVFFVRDAATGKAVTPTAAHTGPVRWMAFSADGKTVTTAGGEEVFVWTTNGERKQLGEFPELGRGRGLLGVSGNQLVWASSSEDGKKTEIVGWDQEKAQVGWRMPCQEKPADLFSHDGKRVVVLDWDEKWEDWQALVYDGPKGKLIDAWTVPNMPAKVNASDQLTQLQHQMNFPGGQFGGIAGGGGRGGPGPGGGRGGPGPGGGGNFGEFNGQPFQAMRALGQSLALAERTGPSWHHPLTLSGDGNTIFVAGSKVIALDALTGKRKVRLDSWPLDPSLASEGSLAASSDGALLAVAASNSLHVVDVKSSKVQKQVQGQFHYSQMKFSPDGKRLAVWSYQGHVTYLYDLESNARPRVLDGGFSAPRSCAFNSQGTSLAVGYNDGTALIWDIKEK